MWSVDLSCPVVLFHFTSTTLTGAGISCRRVSARPSVTSQCFTETAKRRITQTTPHILGSFLMPKISAKLKRGRSTPTEAPNAGEVG